MPILKKRRGRPKKKGAKSHRLDVRITDDQHDILNDLTARTGKTKTDIVKEAIDLYEMMIKSKGI